MGNSFGPLVATPGCNCDHGDHHWDTHVNLLPLADVSDEARQPEQPHEREELRQAQDPQRAARVQDLEALRVLLQGERSKSTG